MSDDSQIKVLAETHYLQMLQDRHWTYVRRPNITGAIAVIGVTDDECVVLIDQYRIPTHSRVIELPAGLVGDQADARDEAKEDAAQRELVEETGYEAANIRAIVNGASSAGLTEERVHLMLATGLKKVGEGGGDHLEDIVVHKIPLSKVDAWLDQQVSAGTDVDFKVYAGLYFVRRFLAGDSI